MSELIDITQNSDILERIFELYVNDTRRETLSYATLKNYMDWLKNVSNLAHTKIYTYGNWSESGLFLIVDRYQLMVSSLKQNDPELGAAMKLLDWRRGYSMYPIAAMQHDIVLKTLEDVKAPLTEIKLFVFKLSREKALKWQIACPAEYELSTLTLRVAALGEDVWSAVREMNKASIACFEKMGFERCGESYYFPAFKVPEDQLWVEK